VTGNSTSLRIFDGIAREPWPAKIAALSTDELAFRVVLDDQDSEAVCAQLLNERLATKAIREIERWISRDSLLGRLRAIGVRLSPCEALRTDPYPYMIAAEAVTEALVDVRDRVLPHWIDQPLVARPPLEMTFTRYSLRFTANPYRHAARVWGNPASLTPLPDAGSDDDSDNDDEEIADRGLGPDDVALLRLLVDQAFALLSPEDGFILRAQAVGWSGIEIARHLGCTPNAVYIRAHDAREQLRGARLIEELND
jgi:hypothetical protein